ncbi:Ig-like domain-containing protein, partial [Echinicola sediminis]
MGSIFTEPKKHGYFLVLSFLLLVGPLASFGQGTKSLADEVTYSSPNVPAGLLDFPPYDKETVENPNHATVDDENFARLLASPGIAVGLGAYNGELELKYPSVQPANTTTFIRVDGSGDIFGLLLGGSLGELLGDVLGLVALGRQEFEVIARNGATDIYSRNSVQGFNVSRARVIVGPDGKYYIAITPQQDYDRIYIENGSLSLLGLGAEVNLDVFNAFTYQSASICGNPVGTSYDVSGIDLDLLDLGGAAADDLHLAIDNDESTYATLSPGVLSLAGILEQHFFFDGLGQSTDELEVTLSADPGVLDVNLLNNIDLVAYAGTVEVGRQDIESLGSELLGIVQLDLLGLLADGNPVTFTMTPGAAFDRLEIEVSTLLNLGTSESLRIHEVKRTPKRPTISGVDSEQNMLVCSGTNVILNATVASGDQVYWYDAPTGGNLVHTGASFNIGQVGSKVTYYAGAQRTGCPEESIRVPVTVDINPNPLISLNGAAVYNVAVGESVTLPGATAVNEDGSPVITSWSALGGAPFGSPNVAGPFTNGGRYTYRVSATGTTCTNFIDVVVNVFDPADCPLVYERRYSTSADDFTVSSLLGLQLGAVTNPNLAAGSDMSGYSLLSETVGTSLLGLTGETSQTIRWNTMVPAGTPVTIKLGREYGVAGVSSGIFVQALDGNPIDGDELIGIRQVADGNLVSAVNGVNEFTYTFIPVDASGVPVAYNGVKISLASLVNAVQNVRVYGAYYHETAATLASCSFGALDIQTGFESIIGGLDVASGLTSVSNPSYAVDGDLNTYASLNNAVGVNISSKLDITFSAPAIAGDSVAIKVGSSVELIDLTLLEGYTIQRYLGDRKVGEPLEAGSSILELNLLGSGTEQALTFINDLPFDRLKFLSGGIVEALDDLRIYEVELVPLKELDGEDYDDTAGVDYIEICPGDLIDLPDATCDQIKLYSNASGGTEITVSDIASWTGGTTLTVYLQVVRFGCEEGIERRPIEIRVLESSSSLLEEILINGANENTFCAVDPVTLEASLVSGAPAGVTYQWYADNTGTPELISGETSASINLNGLTEGAYTYYVEVAAPGYCTSDPVPVNFTINRNAVDGDINLDDLVTQCVGAPVVLSPTSSITSPVFTWYYDEAKTNPVLDGDVDGTATLNLSGSGELTISGLADGADKLYYVTVSGDVVCENLTGKAVNVQISNNLPEPTFTEANLTLCGTGNDAVFEVTNDAGGLSYHVFDSESGGTAITAGVSVSGNMITISNVNADASYWIEVRGAGGCVGTTRGRVEVSVYPEATDSDISISDASICMGESVVLTASSTTVSNPIFRWYSDAGLSNLLFEGASYNVSPAASTAYYVSVEGDGVCENGSGTGKMVSVLVNDLPDVPEVSGDVQLSEGFGTLLTASAGNPAPADVEIVWYDASGNELATGSTYNTGVLGQGTYTYYAEARNTTTACVSASRAAVTVTVNPANVLEDCSVANAQTNGTEAICILCGVENANNAVDGNENTFARFVAPVTATGGVWQDLIFASGGAAGDTVRVTIGTGGSLIDLDLLSGLRFTTYNGATSNSDGGIVDGNILKLRLLGGSSDKAEVVFVAGGNFDRVRVTYRPLLGVLNSGWRIYQAQISFPGPSAISDDVEVCKGEAAILSATPAAGTVLRWYDMPVGGTLLEEGNTYTTEVLNTVGVSTYYLALVRGGCENPERIPVTVKVNETPTQADVEVSGNENPICEGIPVVLTPSVSSGSSLVGTGGVFRWYLDMDKTQAISDGDVDGDISYAIDASGVLSISGLTGANNPYNYYLSVVGDNGCENLAGDLLEVTVTVDRKGTAADIESTGGTICEGDTFSLSASSSTVGNPVFTWYSDAALTTVLGSTDVMPTATTTYYVTVSGDGVCENNAGDAKEVTVVVDRKGTAADIESTGGTICEGDTFSLSASSSTVGNPVFTWYSDASLTTVLGSTDVMPTSTSTYYVTVSGDGVCENNGGDAKEVTVVVDRKGTAADIEATGGTICAGDTFSLSASSSTVTNPVFTWYSDASLTTVLGSTDVMPASTTTYYVTVSGDGVCENNAGDAKEVTVVVDRKGTAADIESTGGTICEGDTFSLSASSSTVGNPVFTWYSDASLTTVLGSTDVMPAATTTYYVTVSGDGVCENNAGDAKEVTVVVDRKGTAADIESTGGTICEGDTFSLSASSSTVTNPVFTWYSDATLTTVLGSTDVMPAATTTYYVTVSGDGVCENNAGDAKAVTVTVDRKGTAADIESTGGTICEGDTFSLSASSSTVTNPVFTWYSDATLTTVLTGTDVMPTATTTYYVTVSGDGVCENNAGDAKEVTVVVDRKGTAADIESIGGTICEGDTFSLSASSSTVTNPVFTWYSDATLTTVLSGTDVMPTSTTTYYVTVSGDGVCENNAGDAKAVTVTVDRKGTAADIESTGGTICEGDTFSLSASSSTVTNPVFTWYSDASLTTVLTGTDVMPTATTTYYVTVSGDGVCENNAGDAKEVTVVVDRKAVDGDINLDDLVTQCVGVPVVLSPTSGISSSVFTWYYDAAKTRPVSDGDTDGTATLNLSGSGELTITGLADGADKQYYVTVSGDGVCENLMGKAVTVQISNSLPDPTFAEADITLCGTGNDAVFEVTNGGGGLSYHVFSSATGGTAITSGISVSGNMITVSNVSTDASYWVEVRGSGGCIGTDRAEISVTVDRKGTAADIEATGGTICEGDTFSLSASSSTVTNPVFTWYSDATLTTVLSGTDVMPTSTTTYYVTVSGDGVCENNAGDAKAVTVTVDRKGMAADIESTGGTICEGDTFSLSASSSTVTNPVFIWYSDASLTTVLGSTDVMPAATTTYYVTVSGDGVCENNAGDAKAVTVTVDRKGTAADIESTGGTICEGDTFSLSASSSTVTNPVFTWYSDASLTTVLAGTDVMPTSTTTYYVTVSGDGVCENNAGDAKVVTVTVDRKGTAADIESTGGTICEGDTFSLSASSSTVTNPVFTWYSDASLTTVLGSTDVMPASTTTYYVTVSGDGVCENNAGDAKEVTVVVDRKGTAADIESTGGTICEGDTFSLSASSSTVTNPVFTWYSDASLTTVLAGTDVMPT